MTFPFSLPSLRREPPIEEFLGHGAVRLGDYLPVGSTLLAEAAAQRTHARAQLARDTVLRRPIGCGAQQNFTDAEGGATAVPSALQKLGAFLEEQRRRGCAGRRHRAIDSRRIDYTV